MSKPSSPDQQPDISEEIAFSRKVPSDNLRGSNRKAAFHKSTITGENEPSKQDTVQVSSIRFPFFAITTFLLYVIQSGMKSLKPIFFNGVLHFAPVETALYIHLTDSLKFVGFVFGIIATDNMICRFKGLIIFNLLSVLSIGGVILGAMRAIHALSIACFCLINFSDGAMYVCFIYITCEYLFKTTEITLDWRHYFLIFSIVFAELVAFIVFPLLHLMLDRQGSGAASYVVGFNVIGGLKLFLYLILHVGITCLTYKRTIHRSASSGSVYLIIYAISRWLRLRKCDPKPHFLDYGRQAFKKGIILSTKKLVVMFPIILPFPIFQAALSQRDVTWTLIANQMNTTIKGEIHIYPEQIQLLGPIIKLILLPLYFLVIQPLHKTNFCYCSLPSKLVLSYFLGGIAFYLLATNERYILNRVQVKLTTTDTLVHFVNTAPCPIVLHLRKFDKEISVPSLKVTDWVALKDVDQKVKIDVVGKCGDPSSKVIPLKQKEIYSMIINENAHIFALAAHKIRSAAHIHGWVKFAASASVIKYGTIKVHGISAFEFHKSAINPRIFWESEYKKLPIGKYEVFYRRGSQRKQFINDFHVHTGVSSTIVITKEERNGSISLLQVDDWRPSSPTVFYLIPIFVLLTLGELLFFAAVLDLALGKPYNLLPLKLALFCAALSFGEIIISIFKVGTLSVDIHAWDSILFGSFLIVTGMLSGQGAYRLTPQLI